jgi:hypothetical protein
LGADQAYLASPSNPKRGVRRWCRCWAPRLTDAELDEIVTYTETSNKLWTHDHSAMVLEVTVRDCQALQLRFIGACDDPNYEARLGIADAKAAARARKYRAKNSTGRKRGRPALNLSPEEKQARIRAQTAKRVGLHRVTQKCITPLKNIGSVTELSVTQPSPKPWELLGMKRSTYFLHKKAGTLPRPIEKLAVIDLDGIDFKKFGITAVRVQRGNDVISAWSAPP